MLGNFISYRVGSRVEIVFPHTYIYGLEVIKEVAKKVGSRLRIVEPLGRDSKLVLGLKGGHQKENAALAMALSNTFLEHHLRKKRKSCPGMDTYVLLRVHAGECCHWVECCPCFHATSSLHTHARAHTHTRSLTRSQRRGGTGLGSNPRLCAHMHASNHTHVRTYIYILSSIHLRGDLEPRGTRAYTQHTNTREHTFTRTSAPSHIPIFVHDSTLQLRRLSCG